MVMDYICCDPLDNRDSESDGSVTCSTDEGILECDYDSQVTRLYHCIEERQWEEVLYFLETGKWYNTSFFSAFGDRGDSPSLQARTWVTALDETGNVRWCQLPLHAAVTFLAPFSVISKLIQVYPKSVRCADDQDMLPLHYAFRFGAEDDVLKHLVEKFPQAVGKKAVKDRLPLDLAQYGPRPERGTIIDLYMQSAVRNAKNEWDQEYLKMVDSMKNNADQTLRHELNLTKDKLSDAVNELASLRMEVQRLRQQEGNIKSTIKSNGSGSVRGPPQEQQQQRGIQRVNSSKSNTSKNNKPPSPTRSIPNNTEETAESLNIRNTRSNRSQQRNPSQQKGQHQPTRKPSEENSSSRRGIGHIFGKRKK